MKKHTKALGGLAASVLALGAAGFGFSRWSSDLNLSGNVTAKGNWDVQITAASVNSLSSASHADATVQVTVYPVYADTYTDQYYRMKVDDLNPQTWDVTLAELDSFDQDISLPGVNRVYDFYTSGKENCTIFYQMQLTDLGRTLGFDVSNGTTNRDNTDNGASRGKLVAYAIGRIKGNGNNKLKIDLGYNKAHEELEKRTAYHEAAVDVTVYPVYAGKLSYSGGEVYRWKIDDANAEVRSMTKSELDTYTRSVNIPGQNNIYNFYTSKKANGCSIFYQMQLTEKAVEMGFMTNTTSEVPDTDNGASDGAFLGWAVAKSTGQGRNTWNIQLDYNNALTALEGAKGSEYYPAIIADDGKTATFADVALDLPGAWAEYSVTIANNGSANANLADYTITAEGTDGAIETTAPSIPAGTVLKPGETCQVTFLAQVPEDYDEDVLDAQGTITVHVSYVQDETGEAPQPGHTHN